MTAHVRAAFGVEAEVVVVKSAPGGSGADVFVVIGEQPVAFFPGAAQSDAQVVGLVAGGQGMGAGVVRVFGAKRYGERAGETGL